MVGSNSTSLSISHCTFNGSPFGTGDVIALYGSNANITSSTINGQPNTENGMRFASGSTGTIQSCTIQNCGAGNGIVIQGGSSPAINGNVIQYNQYHGIVSVENGSAYPVIAGNNIRTNGILWGGHYYHGVVFYNSTGECTSNSITDNYYGLIADYYSSVNSGSTNIGTNFLTGNSVGIASVSNSLMNFGYMYYDEWGGLHYVGACNDIYDNDVNALANISGGITAQADWWGSDPPDEGKFSTANGGWIDYSNWKPYLDPDCNDGGWFSIAHLGEDGITFTQDTTASLTKALGAYFRGDFSTSGKMFRTILQNSTLSSERELALSGLYHVFRRSKNAELVLIIENLQNESSLGLMASELLSSMYIMKGRYQEAKTVARDIIDWLSNTEYEKRALIRLASLGAFSETERSDANDALKELNQKYAAPWMLASWPLSVVLNRQAGQLPVQRRKQGEPKSPSTPIPSIPRQRSGSRPKLQALSPSRSLMFLAEKWQSWSTNTEIPAFTRWNGTPLRWQAGYTSRELRPKENQQQGESFY
ncbi:MAG: right-handed parallel beta-helix repeat-containing protein [Bacteroidota bacterium]